MDLTACLDTLRKLRDWRTPSSRRGESSLHDLGGMSLASFLTSCKDGNHVRSRNEKVHEDTAVQRQESISEK